DWADTIYELFEASTLSTPYDRVGWSAFSAIYTLFQEGASEEKWQILTAMASLIERAIESRDESDWRLAANLIYLSFSLGVTTERLDAAILRIHRSKAPTDTAHEAVHYSAEVYRAAKRAEGT